MVKRKRTKEQTTIYRSEIKEHCDVLTKSELQQNKNPELQLDQHVTAWTASWVNGNHWAYFYGHQN
jgi:hypothetical protein